jgi:hypothetical protein|tara:strand:- start:1183 stop:1464 length:282 start_codon:yes stop_codon:yes gene_type:complete
MAYGLRVWEPNGVDLRLDTGDRQFRYVAFFTGTTAGNSTTTISVAGMATDGTWGLNDEAYGNLTAKTNIGTGSFTHQTTTSSSVAYQIQVFRI